MSAYADLDELCGTILDTSKHIQRVTIINNQGRAVEETSRIKSGNQPSAYTNEMLLMQCVLQVSMGRDFDEQYGPVNYHISERSNLAMLTFPMDEHVILVTANKNVGPISLARKISSLLSSYKMKPVMDKAMIPQGSRVIDRSDSKF